MKDLLKASLACFMIAVSIATVNELIRTQVKKKLTEENGGNGHLMKGRYIRYDILLVRFSNHLWCCRILMKK